MTENEWLEQEGYNVEEYLLLRDLVYGFCEFDKEGFLTHDPIVNQLRWWFNKLDDTRRGYKNVNRR